MKQYNFLAEDNRLDRLSALGDPLEKVTASLDWNVFRPLLDEAFHKDAKGPGGRPPKDRLMMFKIVMLKKWYGLSNDNAEYQINDRLSFQRFLGLTLNERVPDANTIWTFEEHLKETNADLELFALFTQQMEELGVITRKGSIVDASFVDVPRQRNTRKENEIIKEGNIPGEWLAEDKANMLEQKDTDARWAKKNGEVHFGYKNHAKVDQESKMIIDCVVTAANVHDSQVLHEIVDEKDNVVYGDCAFVGEDLHEDIRADYPNIEFRINERAYKNKPLTDEQKERNQEKSRIRVRVEHVFGHMTNAMGGMTIRTIGLSRAIREITMKNLAYNLYRFAFLVRTGRAQKLVA